MAALDSKEPHTPTLVPRDGSGVAISVDIPTRALDHDASRPFVQFLQRIEAAEGVAEDRALRTVRLAAEGGSPFARPDWRAAAWLLERRWPSSWPRSEHRVLDAAVDRVANEETVEQQRAEALAFVGRLGEARRRRKTDDQSG